MSGVDVSQYTEEDRQRVLIGTILSEAQRLGASRTTLRLVLDEVNQACKSDEVFDAAMGVAAMFNSLMKSERL